MNAVVSESFRPVILHTVLSAHSLAVTLTALLYDPPVGHHGLTHMAHSRAGGSTLTLYTIFNMKKVKVLPQWALPAEAYDLTVHWRFVHIWLAYGICSQGGCTATQVGIQAPIPGQWIPQGMIPAIQVGVATSVR